MNEHKRKPKKPADYYLTPIGLGAQINNKGLIVIQPMNIGNKQSAKRLHTWLGKAIAYLEAQDES